MATQTEGIVLNNRRIRSIYFLLELDCPPIAHQARPGQFVMIQTSPSFHPILRRPFSIYETSAKRRSIQGKGRLSILYKKVGTGTQQMTAWKKGQTVNLIGPLGNGYTLPPKNSRIPIILIGGGVGMASLASLRALIGEAPFYVFIGGQNEGDILCENDFPGATVLIATEDGSRGFKGTVVDLFKSEMERFDRKTIHYLFCCGPEGMLRSLAPLLSSTRWVTQVSLEARMACGFGACWGCVVKTTHPVTPYRRVCWDGPVFPLSEVLWDEP